MYYPRFPFPYDRPAQQMTPGALKRAFSTVMAQLPERIENIASYLDRNHGVLVLPTSSDDVLDRLPSLIASLSAWRELSEDEVEAMLIGTRPHAVDILRHLLPRKVLDGETRAMAFDAALLWGDAFRIRYPEAQWAVGTRPKNSINYGDPVLIGIDEYRSEFGLVGEMIGQIGLTMTGKPCDWAISKIMRMRAFQLGLGPDPR